MVAATTERYCGCGTRMARDNADSQCGACVSAGRDGEPGPVRPGRAPADAVEVAPQRDAPRSTLSRQVTGAPADMERPGPEVVESSESDNDSGSSAELMLLRRLLTDRHWQTYRAFRTQYLRAARELADQESDREFLRQDVSERQFARWLDGAHPRPYACRIIEYLLHRSISELLQPIAVISPGHIAGALVRQESALVRGKAEPLSVRLGVKQSPSQAQLPYYDGNPTGELIAATEWPVWFGVRIAHVLSVVHNWNGAEYDVLQNLLHQEILMFDATAPDNCEPAFVVSRRQALVTLATLPVALASSGGFADASAETETFLSNCGASLTACWHLLRGSDLDTVDRLMAAYILRLETVARRLSKYQQVAARLASQAHRICGIIALHRNNLRAREHHCRQALHFASLASDVGSRVSALISLASTYFYESDPARAASTYEEALVFDAAMSPLQRSRTRAELSVVYGQLGREGDAIESAELAEHLYPTLPEDDPSYLFAEFTRASLALEQGLSYAALAEQYPTRGYQQVAADTFARVERVARSSIPDRIHIEIINHQAATAVMLDDLDAFESFLVRGVQGTLLLGSKQRQKEVLSAWGCANERWPREQRLKALGRDLLPALSS